MKDNLSNSTNTLGNRLTQNRTSLDSNKLNSTVQFLDNLNPSITSERSTDSNMQEVSRSHSSPSQGSSGSSVIQMLKKKPVHPDQTQAVEVRKSLGKSRRCAGSGRVKQNGVWSEVKAGSSAGAVGPQQHAERFVLNHFVEGLYNQSKEGVSGSGFAKWLNIKQGKEAGALLKSAKVTDIEMYTELPPCWGCDPWISEIDSAIEGEVESSYSIMLQKYYEDYSTLNAMKLGERKGTEVLFDAHISYILGDHESEQQAYKALKAKNYNSLSLSLYWNYYGSLQKIVLDEYERAKLMEMEIYANGKYTGWLTEVLNKINNTDPFLIVNSFDHIKQQVEKDTRDKVKLINTDYDSIQVELDMLDNFEEVEMDEYSDEIQEENNFIGDDEVEMVEFLDEI
ncbi:hypothetical protein JMN32_19675 [Fulvivirga sp. 29W222]|uniref:Uncharacterized protein n=1 Tax=Fulvivirga marina TaxID=2494733 RepID=A0A937FYN1_9BACT|nr:hypothetical protein [Fulvivirga marina]MBL6448540.1 hypothetical protein [Fulvivirga marina]